MRVGNSPAAVSFESRVTKMKATVLRNSGNGKAGTRRGESEDLPSHKLIALEEGGGVRNNLKLKIGTYPGILRRR